MTERLPSGTRDFLPDEMRELRALTDRLRAVFDDAGYGEVYTPALEYERAYDGAVTPAYRMFDEQGHVLVLRSDMTVPIARLTATRYAHTDPPHRFYYLAHAYRGVKPQRGQSREFLQAGVELIGSKAPEGTAEALTILCKALDAAGLKEYRVGLGDATIYPALLDSMNVPPLAQDELLGHLVDGNFVGLEHALASQDLTTEQTALLLTVPAKRGGPEVLSNLSGALNQAVQGMIAIHDLLDQQTADRIIFDLGLTRSLGYYTGAVFQVYDPAHGVPIGSGGRYDELLGRFGRSLPAVGFALNVERVHIALTQEEKQ
jgi:ATP phosphoribosyltransferase regulatory subunit